MKFAGAHRPTLATLLDEVDVRVGAPVDLADLRDRPVTAATLREGTGRMMAAITDLVAELRGEPAPEGRWDPTTGARVTGA